MASPHRRNKRRPALATAAVATAIAAPLARAAEAARRHPQQGPRGAQQQRRKQPLQPLRSLRATDHRSARSYQSGQLTAGDIDDNLNFDLYLGYKQRALSESKSAQTQYALPDVRLSDRVPIVVLDSDRAPFSNAVVEVRDDSGGVIAELVAGTNGRATLFPDIDVDGSLAESRQANVGATRTGPLSWKIAARPPGGSCPDDCGEAIGLEVLAATNDGVPAGQWTGANAFQVSIPQKSELPRQLDLALVLDTTGSMCDELAYLQSELRGVITSVVDTTNLPENVETILPDTDPIVCTDDVRECPDGSWAGRWADREHGCAFKPCPEEEPIDCTEDAKECPDGSWVGTWGDREHGCAFRPCPGERRRVESQGQGREGGPVDVRVGIVSYRDHGDDYVVRTAPFSNSNDAVASLVEESCGGGGDYPEAMDEALEAASDLKWADGNVARVAFLVADAPPHAEDYRRTLQAALELRRKGVRVYGIAASGVADEAEYMMRLMSLVTGARYAWLTDDSGIGNPHAEPKVKCYQVARLDRLLVRLLRSELTGARMEADEDEIIREVGSQEKGVCIVDFQDDDSQQPTKAPTRPPLSELAAGPDVAEGALSPEVSVSEKVSEEAMKGASELTGGDDADGEESVTVMSHDEGGEYAGGSVSVDATSPAAFPLPSKMCVCFAVVIASLLGVH